MTGAGGTLERWRSEKTGAYLASAAAAAEQDPRNAALFREMAAAAEKQAAVLAHDLGRTPEFTPALRARLIAKCIAAFGPRAMRHVLSASKVRGVSIYSGKTEAPAGHPWPKTVEDVGKQHRSFGGGTLRAGVFGVNDGLVSNTCLVMGVAGAAVEPGVIVLTGVAGLLAGAFSMAAGEFISMLSQREMFEHQISQEAEELKRYPKEEAEELALIYEARGIPIAEARDVAKHLVANPDKALDTLAREELGLNPDDLGSPIARLSRPSFASPSARACRSFRSSLARATTWSSPQRSLALRSLQSAQCSACSPARTPGSAGCACSPSAPPRERRPTGSDRCSTSRLPDASIFAKIRCNFAGVPFIGA